MPSATIITVKKLTTPAPAFGPSYEEFSRPGHDTMRWQYVGQRGAPYAQEADAFFADKDTATAWLQGVQNARGSIITLHGELNAREVTGFLLDADLKADHAVGSTESGIGWQLTLVFKLTPTEPY